MIAFLDSSALVKRYVAEAGSGYVRTITTGEERIAVSWLAYSETLSAVTRRSRGVQSAEDIGRFQNQLAADFKRFLVIDVAGDAVSAVERIIDRHALRGADSIHLATAVWFARTIGEQVLFVASDNHLLTAAKAERLAVQNPSELG